MREKFELLRKRFELSIIFQYFFQKFQTFIQNIFINSISY